MGDLSRNFSRKEFECKCGCGFFKENPLLVATLQRIRDYANEKGSSAGEFSVIVNSGCRCAKHNAASGGVRNSKHLRGEAADIRIPGWESERLLSLIKRMVREDAVYIGYAYIINDTAVHVDVRIPQSKTAEGWRNG